MTSPVVTPTADVPDAPASATAEANPDGTIDVAWAAANGQGRKIISYTVTSVTGGVQAPVGSVTGTTMTIATPESLMRRTRSMATTISDGFRPASSSSRKSSRAR